MTAASLWGKLPAHGDFVARGLTPAAREGLDGWLAGSLAEARDRLGAAFDDAYDQAPPWRFAAREESGWTAGAMAPSVDGVGRRYPILVARGGIAAEQVAPVAQALEDLIYDAFAGGWDADALAAAVAAVDVPPVLAWTAGEGWWTLGAERFNDGWLAGAWPPALMTAVLTPAMSGTGDGAGEREQA